MGFIERIKSKWMAKTTAEKINCIIDLIVNVGSAAGGMGLSRKLGEGQNRVSRLCIGVTCSGLSMAAANVASNSLKEAYTKPLSETIDTVKAYRNKRKEEKANG